MYLTSNHAEIDAEISNGVALALGSQDSDGALREAILQVVYPHLAELRAVRDRLHESFGRLSRGAWDTFHQLEAAERELAQLKAQLATSRVTHFRSTSSAAALTAAHEAALEEASAAVGPGGDRAPDQPAPPGVTHRVEFREVEPPIVPLELTLDQQEHIERLQEAIEAHVRQHVNTSNVCVFLTEATSDGVIYDAHGQLGCVDIVPLHSHPAATGWRWSARYIEPGTPYVDEPSETMPAGWWVIGTDPDDDEVGTGLHIGNAHNATGDDIAEPLARHIAAALTGTAL